MKERIYTIPVNDAFAKDCECALCDLEETTTRDLVNYYMGASMMESDVRVSTNEKGFCRSHLAAMYNLQENRLALGLMLHTHLDDVCKDINHKLEKAASPSAAGKIFAGKGDVRQGLVKLAERIEKRTESCALCERLEYTMDRYIDVILWQYFEESEFKRKFTESKGFCLPHTALLLRGCAKYLSASQASAFAKSLAGIQNTSLETMCKDIEWFTLKFDYRNQDKPWGNSKDAVPRTIRKLLGKADLKQ